MKKSEQLKKEAQMEDNDLKAMGIYKKAIREKRSENFERYKDKLLGKKFHLTEYEDQGKITIQPTKFGIVDYYIKANKILIREKNKWIRGGLNWIINNLLKED